MIVTTGRNRTAQLATSAWGYMGIGTGTATVNLGDQDLTSGLAIRVAEALAQTSANVVFLKFVFSKGTDNSASLITEIGVFDQSTGGNMLFRSVASTLTWSSFTKSSTVNAIVSTSITFSS